MSDSQTYENPLVRDGQSQKDRELKALSPDYVQVDERKREDLVAFASEYSKLIQYYDDEFKRDGSWESFFAQSTDPDQPHYALFLAFTWLFRVLQEDINTITERHLDHYYKEILKLKTKPAEADSVHLLFQIAKNVDQHLLKEGTLLKAGKDENGKELFYALDQDLVLNKAKVAVLKSVFREPRVNEDGTLNAVESYGLYAAPTANSSDGMGQDQDTEGFQWKLFGESQVGLSEYTMPKATMGFAIASPILFLKEGQREINLGITFKTSILASFIPYLVGTTLKSESFTQETVALLEAIYTEGNKFDTLTEAEQGTFRKVTDAILALETIGEQVSDALGNSTDHNKKLDIGLQIACQAALEDAFVVSLSGEEKWVGPFIVRGRLVSSRHIKLEFSLDREQAAVVNYNPAVLGTELSTNHPVLKVQLNNDPVFRYDFLQAAHIDLIKIEVGVQGLKNLVLQSDNATLNANKPFQPFGPLPTLKSNLYIGCTEAFQKELNEFKLNINWFDTPESFEDHYAVYNEALAPGIKALRDQDPLPTEEIEALLAQSDQYSPDSFKAKLAILSKGDWKPLNGSSSANEEFTEQVNLFDQENLTSISLHIDSDKSKVAIQGEEDATEIVRANQIDEISSLDNATLTGFVRLQLTTPRYGRFEAFGHKAFPTFYTEKIIEKTSPDSEEEVALPNEPYTPTISGISLDYNSKVTLNLSHLNDNPEQFFHLAPFGTEEKLSTTNSDVSLLPTFQDEGTLYIGLEGLVPPQDVSILFQLNEKSVNHEFVGKVTTQWSYLSNNNWVNFEEKQILEDHTEVFTRSGIVKFSVPKDITNSNTILPEGMHWFRATIPQNTLGVADASQLAAQAITATFVDQDNAKSHLSAALPAETIKKLKVNDSAVKKIAQPYGSYDGKLEETSDTYYTRVSERLRHKHRAISIWDYERIALEAFPSVYKVKCLNHYNPEVSPCQRQLSPGSVTLLVLSKVEDETEMEKRLAPITNVITLSDIKSHLQAISSPFIGGRNRLFVQNPGYEYVQVKCSVKFRSGYDQGYYLKELVTDIQKYFSPWAFDNDSAISFERKVYKSLIINHIEELEYIDFVCCFKLEYAIDEYSDFELVTTETLEASDPANILVSGLEHQVELIEGDICSCKEQDTGGTTSTRSGIGVMVIESDFEVK